MPLFNGADSIRSSLRPRDPLDGRERMAARPEQEPHNFQLRP